MLIEQIFCDLDECICSTVYKHNDSGHKNRIKITLFNDWLNKPEIYWTQLRPGALEFLECCRSIAPTIMLTAAATDYAQEHNKVLGLGFSDDQIIGRDFYMHYSSSMMHDRVTHTRENYSPNSILIDNQDINKYGSENLRVKMDFLGIKKDRLVKSREYTGGKQPPDFSKEIIQIKNILALS